MLFKKVITTSTLRVNVLERAGALLFLIRTLQRLSLPSNTSLVLNWSKQVIQCLGNHMKNGGEGGIRTHGTLAHMTVFKTGVFDHSADFTDFV